MDSGIGTLLITDIAGDIAARTAAIDAHGGLIIEWDGDGHRSCFDAPWLRAHCYSETERERRRHRPRLWDASLNDELPDFDYTRVLHDENECLRLFQQVRDLGFSRVRQAPITAQGLENLAALFGQLQFSDILAKVADIKTSADKVLVTDTPLPIPKHTDLCYRHARPGFSFFKE